MCSAKYYVHKDIIAPTISPSNQPTSSLIPTLPTVLVVQSFKPTLPEKRNFYCPYYALENTNSAQQNTVNCPIYACEGTTLLIKSGCDYTQTSCSSIPLVRLFDGSTELANGQGCCLDYIYTIPTGRGCRTLSLHQGCYNDYYHDVCSA